METKAYRVSDHKVLQLTCGENGIDIYQYFVSEKIVDPPENEQTFDAKNCSRVGIGLTFKELSTVIQFGLDVLKERIDNA